MFSHIAQCNEMRYNYWLVCAYYLNKKLDSSLQALFKIKETLTGHWNVIGPECGLDMYMQISEVMHS